MNKVQLSMVSFGIIIGLVGILHGIGEILQGSALVTDNMITALPDNWPNAEFFTVMEGQPAFSLFTGIPFYLLGIFAIVVSIALILHSVFFIAKKNGLLIFALLNVGVALFGAGVGTPITLGLPLVVFAWIAKRYHKPKERSKSVDKLNLRIFNLFYGLQIFSWVLFCPGLVIVSAYGKIPEALFLFDFMLMPVSILGALIFGLRYENTVHPEKEAGNV